MTRPLPTQDDDRPGARNLRIAGKRRAALPPPGPRTALEPAGVTPEASAPDVAAGPVEPASQQDLASKAREVPVDVPRRDQRGEPATQAQDSDSMHRFLADPRAAIAAMYAEHPDFKMDKNTNYALPLALRDSIERKSKKLGVPIKQIVAALLLAALETWGEPVETWR